MPPPVSSLHSLSPSSANPSVPYGLTRLPALCSWPQLSTTPAPSAGAWTSVALGPALPFQSTRDLALLWVTSPTSSLSLPSKLNVPPTRSTLSNFTHTLPSVWWTPIHLLPKTAF